MVGKHEPSDEFIEKLEWEVAGEVRRRNRDAPIPRWMPQSGRKAAVVLTGIVLVSMAMGAGGVAAAYQVQGKQRRDDLISGLEQRARVAQRSLELVKQVLASTQKKLSIGAANQVNVLEDSAKVA